MPARIHKTKRFTADEINAIMPGEDYRNCTFDGLPLNNKDLSECRFSSCSFVKADLRNVKLNASVVRTTLLNGARVAGANLFGAVFEECKLQAVDFGEDVNLTGAKFERCNLDYARFRGVSLARMEFERCSFVEADLSLCDLEKTSFVDCDLTRVDFTGTRFKQTDLRGANLTGLNIKKHDFSGAIITRGQFEMLAWELGILIMD